MKSNDPTAALKSPDRLPIRSFSSARQFERWLDKHHAQRPGLWLRIFKRDSGRMTVTYSEALDVALCFGWIDGQRRRGDEVSFLQRFTPRGPRNQWSKLNTGHVERLTREGRMRPAGLAAVEAAKTDGRWAAAYSAGSAFTMPTEIEEAVVGSPAAAAFYAQLDRRNRYAIYYRFTSAKRRETQARRLREIVALLEGGRCYYPVPARPTRARSKPE